MKKVYADYVFQSCYEKGFDAGKNKPNTTNSHFGCFSSPDRTKAWEKGYAEGKKKRVSANKGEKKK